MRGEEYAPQLPSNKPFLAKNQVTNQDSLNIPFRFMASRIFIAWEFTLSHAESISMNKIPPRVTPPISICEIAALPAVYV